VARFAILMGINLNWTFDPATAWLQGEPLRLRRNAT
jgi:hypothetical protein